MNISFFFHEWELSNSRCDNSPMKWRNIADKLITTRTPKPVNYNLIQYIYNTCDDLTKPLNISFISAMSTRAFRHAILNISFNIFRLSKKENMLGFFQNGRQDLAKCRGNLGVNNGHSPLNPDYSNVLTNPFLHDDIPKWTSCAHKWGQHNPALITTHLIQIYPIQISILQSCATQVGILQEKTELSQ